MNENNQKKSGLFKVLVVLGAVAAAITTAIVVVKQIFKAKEKASMCKEIREYFGFMDAKCILPEEGAFSGVTASVVMSALFIDLRDAEFEEESFVSIKALMSAVQILVPEDVKVVVDGKTVLGAVQDNTEHDMDDEKTKTLYIVQNSKLSAISVENNDEED